MSFVKRLLNLHSILARKSVLLLGPRQVGKTTWIEHQLKPDLQFNLLKSATFRNLSERPSVLEESIRPEYKLVVIDEIQLLPELMNEVHALIEERKNVRFVLTGSSARKLVRAKTSLMGGRAKRIHFHPFVTAELPKDDLNLEKILSYGLLPSVFTQLNKKDTWNELQDYVGTYLREEVQAEAYARNIEAFSRFLTVAAVSNAELVIFETIASDAQVPARTVREYFSVLTDTLLGEMISPIDVKQNSRKAVSKSKFYFFDTGVVNSLIRRNGVQVKSPEAGALFECFIVNEVRAYRDYYQDDLEINFWRSPNGDEVDLIINGEIGIEIKLTDHVNPTHLAGFRALRMIKPLKKQYIVSQDKSRRTIDGVEVIHWKSFLELLWAGEITT